MAKSRFITLDDFVRNVCAVMDDHECLQYAKCVRMSKMTLGELNMLLPYIKSELFEIESNFTIQMPDDTIDVLKVGYLDSNRQLRVLDKNDNLRVLVASENEECGVDGSSVLANPVSFVNCYVNGMNGEMFGYRYKGGDVGTWRRNIERNLIELGGGSEVSVGSKLLVEYRTATSNEDIWLIPAESEPAVRWKVLQMMNLSSNQSLSRDAFEFFKISYAQLQDRYRRYSLEDWMLAIKGESMLGIKN
jgi:hypothetical protein